MSDHSGSGLIQSVVSLGAVSLGVLSVEVSRLQGRGRLVWWRGVLTTKIFILLKKIVVDVGKMNDIPQFPLMFPVEG